MARKKTVKEVVAETITTLEKKLPLASEGETKELKEAIDELEDVLGAPELSEDQKRQIIGYKADGTPVFHPGM